MTLHQLVGITDDGDVTVTPWPTGTVMGTGQRGGLLALTVKGPEGTVSRALDRTEVERLHAACEEALA